MTEKKPIKKEPKQYFQQLSRKVVYGGLLIFTVAAILLYLCIPHYMPLKYASAQETTDAHRAIIHKYFVESTTCKQDTRDKSDRIKTFNKYFKTNQFANRAVLRGCNDKDWLLAKDTSGVWQKTNTPIDFDLFQGYLYKACLIDDIMDGIGKGNAKDPARSYVRKQVKACDRLAKESYIEINFKTGIHFHF